MSAAPPAAGAGASPLDASEPSRSPSARVHALLFGGGTGGNEELTTVTGLLLIVLLAVIGVTILRKSQLISVHLFVGLLLIGPVTLKMASTGYRFVRYYTGNRAYRIEGPPELALRLIAPVVVFTTLLVFASGLVLLFEGPTHRGPWAGIHKLSFIVWVAFTALHVLGHLPAMPAALRAARRERAELGGLPPGAAGRWIALVGMCAAGLVLALVLIPEFAAWTAPGAFPHHHHH